MSDVANKLRKGDFVAVVVTHTSYGVKFDQSSYTDISLAKVAESSKEGVVRYVVMAGSTHQLRVGYVGKVYALPAWQPHAKKLFEATPNGGCAYPDKESLKAALEAA
jgi:hypothetical protein